MRSFMTGKLGRGSIRITSPVFISGTAIGPYAAGLNTRSPAISETWVRHASLCFLFISMAQEPQTAPLHEYPKASELSCSSCIWNSASSTDMWALSFTSNISNRELSPSNLLILNLILLYSLLPYDIIYYLMSKNRIMEGIPIINQRTGLYRHTFAPSRGPKGIILNPARNTLMNAAHLRTSSTRGSETNIEPAKNIMARSRFTTAPETDM